MHNEHSITHSNIESMVHSVLCHVCLVQSIAHESNGPFTLSLFNLELAKHYIHFPGLKHIQIKSVVLTTHYTFQIKSVVSGG